MTMGKVAKFFKGLYELNLYINYSNKCVKK